MTKPTLLTNIMTRLQLLYKNTLLMNAFYLMLSTFVLGASGFVFWALVTRAYDAPAVGLATTLLSVSGLLSLLGLAGFDTTFVRFLPGSNRKNDYINTGLIIATIGSTGLGVALGIVLPLLSPSLALLSNPWVFIAFVFFTVVTALNTLTNAVFLAFKQARHILIINTLFSIFKVVLPLFLINGGAIMIFIIAGSAQLFGLILSIVWMRRRFGYTFSPVLHIDTLRIVRRFSFSIYVSNSLSLLPPTLLPLIILYHIGPEHAAYYYMAFTIAGVLYTVVYASMQSVLVEGSHNAAALRSHVVSAAKLITVLLLPTTLLTIILGDRLLSIFGNEYAAGATTLLQLLAIGALPIAVYSALTTSFKITKNLSPVVSMNAISTFITLGLSAWWLPYFGLEAVGWAWIIGNMAACGIGAGFLIKNKRRKQR
jgi:O-antigen/teichoic acid export membrane protein